jgi:ribosomal protein S18 acetylase RimI-like enzyme
MIRQLTLNDFDTWKEIRTEAVKLHPESFGESYEAVIKQDISWFEKSLQNGTIFAYEQNGKMVGIVGTYPMQPQNMRHRAVLFGLYIKDGYRKSGIASALVKHIINFVAPTHRQIHLCVNTKNSAAVALYQKQGFVIYATEPDALLIGDKYYDDYLMMRKL